MSFGLGTYQDNSRREDLLDLIMDASPDANPLSTMFGTSVATQTLHEWVEDYIARPSSTTQSVEGAQATFSDLTQPARRNNFTEIITQTFRVSGTEQAVNVVGGQDPYEYQAAKALRLWKNQLEYNIINGAAKASGSSGVARVMSGIKSIVTSHYTARVSGTSLSETEFNDMVFDVASDVSDDKIFDMVVTGLKLRQAISSFTAGSTKFIDATDKRLVRPVAVYESDYQVHRIFGHKDVYASAATPGPAVFGLNESSWKVAYLRKPFRKDLPDDGDRKAGEIIGEQTLEYRTERANAYRTGYFIG